MNMKKEKFYRKGSMELLFFLETVTQTLPPPMSVMLTHDFGHNPFIILISCLLSLRARDTTVYPICKKLFVRIKTPEDLLNIPVSELEVLFHSIGFYRRKTQVVRAVCMELIERFQGVVPKTEEELLSLPGVGRKTAALVLSEGFGIPAICVDTHVHRLANAFGLVETQTPEQTERALQELLPKNWWSRVNRILVVWGQNVCKTVGKPLCTQYDCPCK